MAWPDAASAKSLDQIMKDARTLAGTDAKSRWLTVWAAAFKCKSDKKHGKHATRADADKAKDVAEAARQVGLKDVAKALPAIQHKNK